MAKINGRLNPPPQKNQAHNKTPPTKTMAAFPGAGIEYIWSCASKKEEQADGKLADAFFETTHFQTPQRGSRSTSLASVHLERSAV
jgi:hypothetical protein